jgi:LPS export ABC transporter protein LptC
MGRLRNGAVRTMRFGVMAGSALLGVILLAGCQSQGGDAGERSSVVPDQEIDGFTLTQTREGAKVWVLTAAHALVFEDPGRIEMTRFRVDFYDEKGSVRSTLTADNGTLLERTNDMDAYGHVVLVAEDGTRLTTEHLTWNERTGKIESEREVRVVRGRDEFTGVGIEADPDLKNIKVKSEFKAFVRTPGGDLVEEE